MPRPSNLPTDGSCETEDTSCLGVLAPNTTYRTKIFKPTVSFSLPTAGWINQYDTGGDFSLESLTLAGDGLIFFRDPRSIDRSVGPAPKDIATWLESNENLAVTPLKPVELGGLQGFTLDVTAAPGATATDPGCPVQVCVPFLRGDDPVLNDPYQWHWDWSVAGLEKDRLYLLTDEDGTVAVVVDSLDGTTFDDLIAAWEKIAPNIKFG